MSCLAKAHILDGRSFSSWRSWPSPGPRDMGEFAANSFDKQVLIGIVALLAADGEGRSSKSLAWRTVRSQGH